MPRLLSPTDVSSFRGRLCQAAERLFSEQGPAAVTMRQLALELGCSPMTPYRYFRDKDEILAAVRAAAFDRLSTALQQALRPCGGCNLDSAPAAMAMGRAYVTFALTQPQTYRLMFDFNQPGEELYPDLAAAVERARQVLSSDRPVTRSGDDLAGQLTPFGSAQWAAVHGVVMLHLAGKLPRDTDVLALAEYVIAHLRPMPDGGARRVGRGR